MLERFNPLFVLFLASCLLLSSCAHFTASGRSQLAYAKYVRNAQKQRVHKSKTEMKLTPQLPLAKDQGHQEMADVRQGPQSASSGQSPVTVSTTTEPAGDQ